MELIAPLINAFPVETANPVFRPKAEDNLRGINASPFESLLKAAMDTVSQTNLFQKEADAWQLALATGGTDDILAVQMAQDKAFTALNFTTQVTNKIIESYREIMRMQL